MKDLSNWVLARMLLKFLSISEIDTLKIIFIKFCYWKDEQNEHYIWRIEHKVDIFGTILVLYNFIYILLKGMKCIFTSYAKHKAVLPEGRFVVYQKGYHPLWCGAVKKTSKRKIHIIKWKCTHSCHGTLRIPTGKVH